MMEYMFTFVCYPAPLRIFKQITEMGCCVSVMYSTFRLPSLSCVKFQNTLSALYSERVAVQVDNHRSPSNAELNPIYHLLALLGAHHILHVSRVRGKV